MNELLRLLASPTEWFPILSALNTVQLIAAIAITAGAVAMMSDWRLGLLAQLLQYLFVGLLLARETLPQLAMVKTLVGGLACFVLYWTGRMIENQARQGRVAPWLDTTRDDIHPRGISFRLMALAFWSLALTAIIDRYSLTELSAPMNSGAYWLVGMGLLAIILTRDPFRTGLGLLTIGNGIEMVYMLYEPGLVVLGILGVSTILTALVAAYLTVIRQQSAQPVGAIAPDPASPEALAEAVRALSATPPPAAGALPAETPEEVAVL